MTVHSENRIGNRNCRCIVVLVLISAWLTSFQTLSIASSGSAGERIGSDFVVEWSDNNINSPDGGWTIQLALDYSSGSGIGSINTFLYGYFNASIKLVPGNSAGTLATFYLKTSDSSQVHDELDFEFMGNLSGQPYVVQTNIFAKDSSGREQRTLLPFDPTADFHQYAILWNAHITIFYVDSSPIRIYPNNGHGIDYPGNPMKLYATIYNAEEWVTQGGKVKIDWSGAPFIFSLRDSQLQGCPIPDQASPLPQPSQCSEEYGWQQVQWWNQPQYWSLNSTQMMELREVQEKYMIYDYCTDFRRYPNPPSECAFT